VHGLHHQLEHGVEDLSRFLGIAAGQQFHRTLEIGEEDRHLLAFPSRAALDVRILSARCLGV
jgi:hypothetical protein